MNSPSVHRRPRSDHWSRPPAHRRPVRPRPEPGTACLRSARAPAPVRADRSRPTTRAQLPREFQRLAASCATTSKSLPAAGLQVLQIARAGIGGPAQHDHAAIRVRQERLERVGAQIGIDGHGIGAVALEGLDGVTLGGIADIAALASRMTGIPGMMLVDVFNGALQLILGFVRRVMRELRLVGAYQVRGRIDDGAVELKYRGGLRPPVRPETSPVRGPGRRRPGSHCASRPP